MLKRGLLCLWEKPQITQKHVVPQGVTGSSPRYLLSMSRIRASQTKLAKRCLQGIADFFFPSIFLLA